MRYNYCTLFNSSYLTRGLAMYESLARYSKNFHLYIFAFDKVCYNTLLSLSLKNVTVISLDEFEDKDLLQIKKDRTVGEYCWTSTSSTIKYSIEQFNLDNCTYLDADLYFYSDPSVLIDEMGNKSVLITEHRYSPKYIQNETSGIYCVQFMTFKNNPEGLKVLNWWRRECLNWCYNRHEDGKFGDQKYLDDWTTRFNSVHVLENIGGGVAPWNIQQYDITDNNFKLIFYHFHSLKILENNKFDCGVYLLKKHDIEILYKPYIKHLLNITKIVSKIDPATDFNGVVLKSKFHWKDPLSFLKRVLKGTYNIVNVKGE